MFSSTGVAKLGNLAWSLRAEKRRKEGEKLLSDTLNNLITLDIALRRSSWLGINQLLCLMDKNTDLLHFFSSQGKSFIKDALKCKAHALRHKFSCISRKCPAIKEMVFQLQRECYLKHDLCSAAKENVQVIVEMIHFKDLLQHE